VRLELADRSPSGTRSVDGRPRQQTTVEQDLLDLRDSARHKVFLGVLRFYTFVEFVVALSSPVVCKSSELQKPVRDSLDREHLASYRLTGDAVEARTRVG